MGKNKTVICHICHKRLSFPCLSLYSVDSLRALICYFFVNYCLLYWFCWLISLIRLSAFLLLLGCLLSCFCCLFSRVSGLRTGNVDLFIWEYDFILDSLTRLGEAHTMKNTQGVPSGRGQTVPESLPADFHITFCGPVWVCASEGVFMPML